LTELFLLDKNFSLLGVIDSFISLSWKRSYYNTGEFSLIAFPEHYSILSECKFIHRKDIDETVMVESLSFSGSESGGNVTVSGRSVKALLASRIIDSRVSVSGFSEDVILSLVSSFAVTPTSSERKIPFLSLQASLHRGSYASFSLLGENLLDCIEQIAAADSLSCDIAFSFYDNSLVFKVWQGLDRSDSQTVNSKAIFSDDFENVRTHKFIRSSSDYKNFAYISGSDYGCEDIIETVDLSNGSERFEVWINAGKVKESGSEFNELLYRANLKRKGLEKLSQYSRSEYAETVLSPNSSLIYRKDFDLGDLCSYIPYPCGSVIEDRITSVCETFKDNATEISITLGSGPLSVVEQLKRGGIYLP